MENVALEMILNKKALVFAGGGVNGFGILGCLRKLKNLGFDFNQVKSYYGTSIGSLIATALACKGSIEYMENKINSYPLLNLEDRDFILVEGIHLLRKFGIHETEGIDAFVGEILTELVGNKDITFKQLYEKTQIYLGITYLSINYGRTILADHIYEPDSLVRKTLVKSSSIPIFYEAFIEGKGADKTIDVDGAIANNPPIYFCRQHNIDPHEILAFNFISPNTKQLILNGSPGNAEEWTDSPTNIVNFLYRFVQILRNHSFLLYSNPEDDILTVKINVANIASTSFNLSLDEKQWLYNQGQLAIENYIEELTEYLKSSKINI